MHKNIYDRCERNKVIFSTPRIIFYTLFYNRFLNWKRKQSHRNNRHDVKIKKGTKKDGRKFGFSFELHQQKDKINWHRDKVDEHSVKHRIFVNGYIWNKYHTKNPAMPTSDSWNFLEFSYVFKNYAMAKP